MFQNIFLIKSHCFKRKLDLEKVGRSCFETITYADIQFGRKVSRKREKRSGAFPYHNINLIK